VGAELAEIEHEGSRCCWTFVRRPSRRILMKVRYGIGLFATTMFGAAGLGACGHDFDAFEGHPAEVGDAGPESSPSAADGATPPVPVDSGGVQDASPEAAPDAACAATPRSIACVTQRDRCRTQCDGTYQSCRDACGGSTCRQKCASDQTTCYAACTTTCATCAGCPGSGC
jgi:hypothetical protein